MTARVYAVSDIKRAGRANRVVSADLTENGLVIAQIRPGDAPWLYRLKFFSERAAARFDDFCDSLSRSETVEALIG